MPNSPFPMPGIYRHYKNNYYFVEGIGQVHDTEQWVVIYRSTKGEDKGVIWLRNLEDFNEIVLWPDGFDRPRFIRVGVV